MEVREIRRPGFVWLDIVNPDASDLNKIGQEYNLDLTTINDCMEPEHLPKYEIIDNTTFIILRAYDLESNKKSDKVQTITNKVAMFFSHEFIITIHRVDQQFLKELYEKMNSPEYKERSFSSYMVANDIMFKVARTYETGITLVYQLFDAFEQDVFNKNKKLKMVQSYLLKRRIDVVHRVLTLMKDPVVGLMNSAQGKIRLEFKNTKEYMDKLIYQVDVVHDNLVALLNLQLALQSQVTNEASRKTNEVVRILTIFSVFFMPINFIASIFGMNFQHLPLIESEWGFWLALGFMVIVTLWIFVWFLKKGFMGSRDLL